MHFQGKGFLVWLSVSLGIGILFGRVATAKPFSRLGLSNSEKPKGVNPIAMIGISAEQSIFLITYITVVFGMCLMSPEVWLIWKTSKTFWMTQVAVVFFIVSKSQKWQQAAGLTGWVALSGGLASIWAAYNATGASVVTPINAPRRNVSIVWKMSWDTTGMIDNPPSPSFYEISGMFDPSVPKRPRPRKTFSHLDYNSVSVDVDSPERLLIRAERRNGNNINENEPCVFDWDKAVDPDKGTYICYHKTETPTGWTNDYSRCYFRLVKDLNGNFDGWIKDVEQPELFTAHLKLTWSLVEVR